MRFFARILQIAHTSRRNNPCSALLPLAALAAVGLWEISEIMCVVHGSVRRQYIMIRPAIFANVTGNVWKCVVLMHCVFQMCGTGSTKGMARNCH